ncbi:fungal-specific transcription factor domain-containing protein [Lentinula aciculospora]|uniref:Fungal-specific transcription factor domain-containing protein n=1 Tax=Lentinula aciculospora TaxID=153920 RepID=A0A9W9DXL6_9AGAR|nr:fungal-specific transcription factor domain-containing protein [Lentinula aciculospora]
MLEDSEPEHKKPRLPNACTNCRSKKIKCDSAVRPGNICSYCIAHKIECTRELRKKKRAPRLGNPQRSIQATVDVILSTRRPFEVPKDPVTVKGLLVDLANYIKDLEEDIAQLRQGTSSTTLATPQTAPRINEEGAITIFSQYPDDPSQSSDSYSIDNLTQDLQKFGYYDDNVRHFGGTSSRSLVQDALTVKKEYASGAQVVNVKTSFKRPEFWSIQPWQKTKPETLLPYQFPPEDLITDLVNLYFTQLNPLLPLLHRPSFLRCVAEGLHRKDRHFGGLLLAVCALGARFSDDNRVFEDYTTSEQSIGWKWIRQIQPLKHSFDEPPSIYEIQLYTAYILFVGTTTTPEACWILISIGVRSLQDVGAHRRPPNHSKPSVETESWKRVFWFMSSIDILASTLLGRPRSMSQNDCDADLPIDCDDEYWDHPDPGKAFQQPPDRPSTMSYWICFLKLMNIADLTLHSIHAVKQSDIWSAAFGLSKREWNEKTVSELDSLLNKWADEIPDHLKWDPNRENIQHFNESVVLYTTYYGVQILVHRPFIHGLEEDPHSNIPSLAICANAARSCLHVIEIQQQRKTHILAIPSVMIALFNSAIVVLVNMWRGKHFIGSSSNISKELADVHRAIDALHLHEQRWEQAGRLADILMKVISVSHFQQSSQPRLSLKRSRMEVNRNLSSSFPVAPGSGDREKRRAAESDRVLDITEAPYLSTTMQEPPKLPLNSNELGILPIFEPFDWSTAQNQWSTASGNQEALNPWTSTGSQDDMNQLYPASSESFTDFPSEESFIPSQSLDGGRSNSSTLNDLDDWASYMATIDEVLQAANPRMS